MERYWLVAASFCFLLNLGQTLFTPSSGFLRSTRLSLAVMACQRAFSRIGGRQSPPPPLTDLVEALAVPGWPIVPVHAAVDLDANFRLALTMPPGFQRLSLAP